MDGYIQEEKEGPFINVKQKETKTKKPDDDRERRVEVGPPKATWEASVSTPVLEETVAYDPPFVLLVRGALVGPP